MATPATYTSVTLPKHRKRAITGLVILSIFIPPLAVYLDGASSLTVILNFCLWYFAWIIPGIIHAIIYLLRPQKRRNMSRPARYRLWVNNTEGRKPHEEAGKSSVKAGNTKIKSHNSPERATDSTSPEENANPEDPFEDPPTYISHE